MQYGDFVKNKQSILYPCIPGLKSCLHTRTQNAKQIQALLLFIENLTTCFTFCILHTTCLSPTDVKLLSALPNLWVKIQAFLRLEVHYSACRISTSRHPFSQASIASWCQDCCLQFLVLFMGNGTTFHQLVPLVQLINTLWSHVPGDFTACVVFFLDLPKNGLLGGSSYDLVLFHLNHVRPSSKFFRSIFILMFIFQFVHDYFYLSHRS